MSVVFILCVPVGGAVLRFVSVLYSLMVKKVERLLRGQWSAFNIYVASRCASSGGVSSSRLVFLLVPRLVSRLVHRLVCASCSSVSLLRSVSFVSFRFISCRLCVLSRRVSRCGVLCRWRLVSFFRLVSRFVLRLVVLFVLSCRVAFVASGGSCGTWRRGRRRWCSLVVMRCCGGGVLFPVFRLARRGQVDRVAPFYPARSCPYLRMSGSGSWQDGIDMR